MTTVIYVHGFGSSSSGDSASLFKKYSSVNNFDFIGFDYSVDDLQNPSIILSRLKTLIDSISDNKILVGSSLGGFFANFIAIDCECPVILINPSMQPSSALKKYGFDDEILEKYIPIKFGSNQIQRTIICGNEDTIVNQNENGRTLVGKIVNITMGHRIEPDKMNMIFGEILSTSKNIIDMNSDY